MTQAATTVERLLVATEKLPLWRPVANSHEGVLEKIVFDELAAALEVDLADEFYLLRDLWNHAHQGTEEWKPGWIPSCLCIAFWSRDDESFYEERLALDRLLRELLETAAGLSEDDAILEAHTEPEPSLTNSQREIVEVVRMTPHLEAKEIAQRMGGATTNEHLKHPLSNLVKKGVLNSKQPGYTLKL